LCPITSFQNYYFILVIVIRLHYAIIMWVNSPLTTCSKEFMSRIMGIY
jgi:hypothetical protein